MSRLNAALVVAFGLVIVSSLPANADRTVIKDGFGEELNINNGWFGRKDVVIKDRLGDKFVQKKGWFGGKETEVNLFGNKIKRKKGWFGSSKIEADTILGDSVKSKKGWFGGRNTEVDVSGVASAIKGLFGKEEIQPMGAPGNDPGLDPSLPPELQGLPPSDVPEPTYSGR